MSLVADRRLYLTSDRSGVVEEGDPASAFLFCAAGREIRPEAAKRYGLSADGGKVVLEGASPEPDEWTLKMPPEEYLERYGADAKNSELARRVLGAG